MWLRQHDCPWNEKLCAYAAANGHLEVLKWAREHGCPWQEDIEYSIRDLCTSRYGRAPGGAEVASGERLPVGQVDMCERR